MNYTIELEQEEDGRIIAEVIELPGVLAYGKTKEEAIAKAQALALHVIADRLEHGETGSDWNHRLYRDSLPDETNLKFLGYGLSGSIS